QGPASGEKLGYKQEQGGAALPRLGDLEGFALEPIEPAVEQWRYRNKLEYSFGDRDGELVLGFHARGRWDEIIDAEDCRLASERNNAMRNQIRAWGQSERLDAYDRRAQPPLLRQLIIP